jgi:hypothetical protein
LHNLIFEKVNNLNNYVCIGDFGMPPAKDSFNKDEFIQRMKSFGFGNKKYTQEDGYHIVDTFAHEIIVNGRENWPVEYKYNSELFRCDHFTDSHKGLHVLFSGCSVTEGVGIAKEDTWPYRLYKKISEEKEVSGYFNLAHAGNGYHQIIGNFLEYIKRYGKPDIFVVLHPNIERKYKFLKDENLFTYKVEAQRLNEVRPTTPENYFTAFAAWAKVWDNFEKLCKVLGVQLVWGGWDSVDQFNIKALKIFQDSFIALQNFNSASELSKILVDFELDDRSIYARDTHPGPVSHYIWATNFFDEIKKRNLL